MGLICLGRSPRQTTIYIQNRHDYHHPPPPQETRKHRGSNDRDRSHPSQIPLPSSHPDPQSGSTDDIIHIPLISLPRGLDKTRTPFVLFMIPASICARSPGIIFTI
ncbi:hypothetical protein BDW42DRAFT_172112, partial [Aspergillus taichungensis]